jgi:hypothetical protein
VEPDPDRALALASRAVELSEPEVPARLDTLARAYWEVGEVQRAIETQRRAVTLAPNDAALQRTLERYERGERGSREGSAKDRGKANGEAKDPAKSPR